MGDPRVRPGHPQLVEELKAVRERGIVRLRELPLPGLGAVARQRYPAQEDSARAIEELLRDAVAELGDGELGELAAISFGLARGKRGKRPADLRKDAAFHRGVVPETFRKTNEPVIMQDLAGAVLSLFPGQPSGVGAASSPESIDVVGESEASSLYQFSVVLERWEPLMRRFGSELLDYFCERPDPCEPQPLGTIAEELLTRVESAVSGLPLYQVVRLIEDAQAHGYAPGVATSADGFFLPEDHIAWKLARNVDAKQVIGETAAAMVRSGSRVALDAGSTTLPVARHLAARVDSGHLRDVTIFTNSAPIAAVFTSLFELRGWSDDQAPVRIYVGAGLLRPNTRAIATLDDADAGIDVMSFRAGFDLLGPPDLCFVGANGITVARGMTIPTRHEVDIKHLFLTATRDAFIVADASKFGLSNAFLIASWDADLTVLTNRPDWLNQELEDVLGMQRTVRIKFASPRGTSAPTR